MTAPIDRPYSGTEITLDLPEPLVNEDFSYCVTLNHAMDWQCIKEFVREDTSPKCVGQFINPGNVVAFQQPFLTRAHCRTSFENHVRKATMVKDVARKYTLARP